LGKTSINELSVGADVVFEEKGRGFCVLGPPQTGLLDIMIDEGTGVVCTKRFEAN
jgi:hypothetical protein